MKINVAICDGAADGRRSLLRFANEYISRKPAAGISIDVFKTYSELLSAAEKKTFGLVLLEILPQRKEGLETAAGIRALLPDAGIVFISETAEYAQEAFAVNAKAYLVRPLSDQAFSEVMDRMIGEAGEKEKMQICVKDLTSEHQKIDASEILYIEERRHTTRIVTRRGRDVLTKTPIEELYGILKDGSSVVRCGCYLVSLADVRNIDRYSVRMLNEIRLPLAKKDRELLREKYLEYFES